MLSAKFKPKLSSCFNAFPTSDHEGSHTVFENVIILAFFLIHPHTYSETKFTLFQSTQLVLFFTTQV